MPELPEVEVVRIFLEEFLTGKTITDLEVLNPKSFIGDPKKIIGQSISAFSRHGKQLSIKLSGGDLLLVHLKMTGQLILQKKDQKTIMGHPTKDMFSTSLPNKSTRLVFYFDDTLLYFNDQRIFGWIKLISPEDLALFQSPLGLDILDPNFTPDYIFSQLQRSQRAVKLSLLDQHFFAGIGNIYANDALFLSKIHPLSVSKNLTLKDCTLLHKHLLSIMNSSIAAGGSTMKDNKYLRPDGTTGSNQFNFRVYQKKGEPCPKCKTPIEYLKIGGRGTFFCPSCQKIL